MDILIHLISRCNDPYPLVIEIHPTDICNHSCDYCFHRGKGYNCNRSADLLDLTQYRSLFSEMRSIGVSQLTISGGGEPFADQRINSLLELANKNQLEVRIVSNGNLLTENLIDPVLTCSELRISMDAITPETYSRIRHVPGSLLTRTIETLALLIERKFARQSSLSIGTSFLINKLNFKEAVDFSVYMLNLGVDAVVIKHDIYGDDSISKIGFIDMERRLKALGDARVEIRNVEQYHIVPHQCFVPYFKVAFNPYGELFSCPLGAQPGQINGYFLGSLHSQKSFRNIWRNSFETRKNMQMNAVKCANCNHTDSLLNHTMQKRIMTMIRYQ